MRLPGGAPGPRLRALEGPAAGSLRNLLAGASVEERKGAKAEREWNERGGQRAIRVSAPAPTQVPECWVGPRRGPERAGEGGAEGNPPKSALGSFFSQESRRSLEMVCVSGRTHGLHHFTTTSQLPCLGGFCCLGGRCQSLEGLGAARGSFLAAPERGSVCERLPSDKLGGTTQDFPRRCWVARLPGWGRNSLPVYWGKASLGL